jgi:hypothetical protein
VQHRRTGILLDTVDPPSIAAGVREAMRLGIDPAVCRRNGERFSEARFAAELERLIEARP